MSLKVKLYNLFMRIAHKFAEPECCGLLRNSDGHLVKYDEWEGYQSCYFPGCGHYQSEHGDGTPSKVLYSKDHPELVGTEVSHAKGCWNAGCEDCPGFWTKEDLHNFMREVSRARNHANYAMAQMGETWDPNVKQIEAKVDIVVRVVTTVGTRDRQAREALFEREKRLRGRFPDVSFDFDIIRESDQVKDTHDDGC